MTFWQHWRRGAFVVVMVGLAALSAAIAGSLITALVVFLPLEIFWHRNDWGDLENSYLIWAAILAVIVWGPFFLSEMFKGELRRDWPGSGGGGI